MEAADFAALFEEFGASVTVVHIAPAAIDPDTQVASAPAEVEETTTGVVRQFHHRDVDGQAILASDQRVMLDPSGLTSAPDGDDQLEIGANRYAIVRVRTWAPDGNVLAYDCQVRGLV